MATGHQQQLHVRKGPWTTAAINTVHRSMAQAITELAEYNESLRQLSSTRCSSFTSLNSLTRPRPIRAKTADISHTEEPEWATKRTSSDRPRPQKTYSSRRRSSRTSNTPLRPSSGGSPVVVARAPSTGEPMSARSFRLRDSLRASSTSYNTPPPAPVFNPPRAREIPQTGSQQQPIIINPGPERKTGRYHRRESSKYLPPESAQNGLVICLEDILVQTNLHANEEERASSNTGSPSLLATCLMNVPTAIRHEAQLRIEEDPDDKSDVDSEVFEFLLERPWIGYPKARHMAEVVRSRAVMQVTDAIAAGIVDAITYRAIWDSCVALKCMIELNILETAWHSMTSLERAEIRTLRPEGRCNIVYKYNTCVKVKNVYGHWDDGHWDSGYWGICWYRQLRSAFNAGALDSSFWTGANTNAVLYDAVKAIEDAGEPSLLLLDVLSRGLKGGYVLPTESSSSPSMMEAGVETAGKLCPVIAQLVSFAILKPCLGLAWPVRCAMDSITTGNKKQSVVTRMLVLAANIVFDFNNLYTSPTTRSPLQMLCDTAKSATDRQVDIVAHFICEVGHDLAFKTNDAPEVGIKQDVALEFLQPLLESLLAWQPSSSTDASADRTTIRHLVLYAALSFAHKSFSPRRIAFAQGMEERITQLKRDGEGTATMLISPERPVTMRWEEGMCEWVALTPAPTKLTVEATTTDIEDLHVSSPVQPQHLLTLPPSQSQEDYFTADDEENELPTPSLRKRSWQVDGASDDFDALPSSGSTETIEATADRATKRPKFLRASSSALNIMPLRKVLKKAKSFVLDQKEEGGDELA